MMTSKQCMSFIYSYIEEIDGYDGFEQVIGMIRMARFGGLISYSENKELRAAAHRKLHEVIE